MSVIAGDDFEKAIAAAIIDGFLNGEWEKKDILRQIDELGKEQNKSREEINRQLRKSKVNFNVMGE